MRRSWFRWSAVAALGVAAAFVRPAAGPDACAQDLDPPLVGMHEMKDGKEILSFEFPARTKDVGPDPSHEFGLAWFHLILHNQKANDLPEATMWVDHVPGYARAAIAHSVSLKGLPGAAEEPLRRTADGLWEEVRRDEKADRRFLMRWIEHEDRLFLVTFTTTTASFPKFRPHFDRIAASMKVLQLPPRTEIAKGLFSAVVDGRELLTDRKDRKGTKRLLDAHLAGWKQAAKLLGPRLAWKGLPVVAVIDDQATWAAVAGGLEDPFIDEDTRAVICSTKHGSDAAWTSDYMVRMGAKHYIRSQFGGQTPIWIEEGLAQWTYGAAKLGGKPEKIPGSELRKLRAAVEERDTSMPGLWRLTPPADGDYEASNCDLWAWHLFFRHAPEAGKWGNLYRKSLDLLATEGDLAGAEKLWADVDGDALKRTFREWLAGWKP